MVNPQLRNPHLIAQEKMIEKEIIETKKYIKKIWGRTIPIKKMSYKEIEKLGEELGMNVFNSKKFNHKNKTTKKYVRVCNYCSKSYDVELNKKIHPRGTGVCPVCKKKSDIKRMENRKIKNKNKWDGLILDVLKVKKKLSINEIAEELNCSTYPIRCILKSLKDEGKINIFIGPKKKQYLIYNEK